jgi:hypothetical protein
MAINIKIPYTTGKTLVATLERESDGFFWNDVAEAWQANPSFADRSIALTERTGNYLTVYAGANSGDLGDGLRIALYVHDTGASNAVVSVSQWYVVGGNEVVNVDSIANSTQAATNLKDIYGSCVASGTVNTVTGNGDFTLTSADLVATDAAYVDMMLIFTGGNNQRIPRVVGVYTGATKRVQFGGSGFRGSFPLTVQAGDAFKVFSGSP